MKRNFPSRWVRWLSGAVLGLAAPLSAALAQEKVAAPAGAAVNITVTAGTTPPPPVSLILHQRHGHVTPVKGKHAHTGGGLIDIVSPAPDTVVITMSGAVVANGSMAFDLDQLVEVSFDDPKLKKAKLTIEGRVVGLLRGEPLGCAEYTDASAHLGVASANLVGISVPTHSVCQRDSLAVNDHDGPYTVPVLPGKYTLHQTFTIAANSRCRACKRPSAEFAPDPAIDPLWINYWEPFHGVKKDTFGFQVTVRVAPDTDDGNGNKKGTEVIPPPVPGKEKP
jgi:hypothetical protein